MDLQPYVERIRHELSAAAATGGADAQELADRLSAPLESALRLTLLEALSDAAAQITRELAPASVEVRLRGIDPEFAVSTAPVGEPHPPAAPPESADDEGGTWRVTLRLPAHLRGHVDTAAQRDGISVNAWLGRAVSAALGAGAAPRRATGQHLSGWVR